MHGGGVGEGPTRDVVVGEEFVGAGFAEEGDGAGALGGGKGVAVSQ